MDYMEAMDHCMDPVRGYHSKVWADRIDYKLKNENDLSAAQRKNLEEDLAAFKEAYKNKSDDPTIAGQAKSQRYFSDAADEDQIWVNAEYNKFNAKIMNKCEGADHMQTGHRTEFVDASKLPSGDEALAEYKAEHDQQRAAFNARRDEQKSKMQGMQNCMQGLQGLRWKIAADKLEAKINAGKAGGDRKNWEADLASLRDAEQNNRIQLVPADPNNPNRYMMHFTTDETMAINNDYIAGMQDVSNKCAAMAHASNDDNPSPYRRRH